MRAKTAMGVRCMRYCEDAPGFRFDDERSKRWFEFRLMGIARRMEWLLA
jgi:hypothetical protein